MTTWTREDIPNQSGRVVVVTGANAGLGREIARSLALAGATVVMACRNSSKAEACRSALLEESPSSKLDVVELDLASLDSVGRAASEITERFGSIDLLINNAGLMATDFERTDDGFELQFGVNHLGHFAFTLDLLPAMRQTGVSRVVTMSSMGHRMGRMNFVDLNVEHHRYNRWSAYFQSKLANILFARELDRRLVEAGSSVRSLAAHPGASNTDLGSEGGGVTNRAFMRLVPLATQSAEVGAFPLLRAATDPTAGGGTFFGPRWIYAGRLPVEETPSRRARNIKDARRLWEISERLTGRTFSL